MTHICPIRSTKLRMLVEVMGKNLYPHPYSKARINKRTEEQKNKQRMPQCDDCVMSGPEEGTNH